MSAGPALLGSLTLCAAVYVRDARLMQIFAHRCAIRWQCARYIQSFPVGHTESKGARATPLFSHPEVILLRILEWWVRLSRCIQLLKDYAIRNSSSHPVSQTITVPAASSAPLSLSRIQFRTRKGDRGSKGKSSRGYWLKGGLATG